ncbi:hypothetical protein J5N97_018553 [Dioscorea zingiberensis]|uniref:Reverse transcriptase zinc-binding domain-containing protein n=1 Tax=Dioscorea zingiberensis TaxID=325984 RepID=A0A9D5HBL3_9LILI|nr:hypothetical protein J5N97_018553 [Dioscorea zingiberensis]
MQKARWQLQDNIPLLKEGPLTPIEDIIFADILTKLEASPQDIADERQWLWGTCFSVKSLYEFLVDGGLRCPIQHDFWGIACPTKVKLFAWLAWDNKLLTLNNLSKRGWQGDRTQCYLSSAAKKQKLVPMEAIVKRSLAQCFNEEEEPRVGGDDFEEEDPNIGDHSE